MKNTTLYLTLSFLTIMLLSTALYSQEVGNFYGSTDGSEAISMTLGKTSSNANAFKYYTTDGGSGTLRIHSYRWGGDFIWSRSSSSGTKNIAKLYAGGGPSYFELYDYNGNTNIHLNAGSNSYFAAGNFGIGTSSPSEKLEVNGTIRSKEVKVESTDWPDYVFKEDYILPSLKETESYIKENQHLPGIPSAQEVKEGGISLGEMNAKLLEKIEELTLHQIDLLNMIRQQQEEIDQLKKKHHE